MSRTRLEQRYPGATAEVPTDIPREGWLQIVRRAWRETKDDQVPLLAAGVAFYSFLALFPALIAAVMLYGLMADPATVREQTANIASALPKDAAGIVVGQMKEVTAHSSQSLGLGLVIALLLALWSASGGVTNLVTALNAAYDEEETRGFVKRKALSLGLTLAGMAFVLVAVALIAAAPAVLDTVMPGGIVYWLIQVGRWVGLVVAVAVALGVLYRFAPDRDAPRVQWVSVGAVVATVIWVVASVGFSFYVSTFGSYAKTYGALAGVAVLLLWLWITNFIILLGAEINSEAEAQTMRDTTRGDPLPMGERNAVKADYRPGEDPEG